MQNTAKQNYPDAVTFYNTWPGNEVGLFYNAPKPTQARWKFWPMQCYAWFTICCHIVYVHLLWSAIGLKWLNVSWIKVSSSNLIYWYKQIILPSIDLWITDSSWFVIESWAFIQLLLVLQLFCYCYLILCSWHPIGPWRRNSLPTGRQ